MNIVIVIIEIQSAAVIAVYLYNTVWLNCNNVIVYLVCWEIPLCTSKCSEKHIFQVSKLQS